MYVVQAEHDANGQRLAWDSKSGGPGRVAREGKPAEVVPIFLPWTTRWFGTEAKTVGCATVGPLAKPARRLLSMQTAQLGRRGGRD
jgi:hypothetical protein